MRAGDAVAKNPAWVIAFQERGQAHDREAGHAGQASVPNGAAPPGIDREACREGKRPLIEPLGAQRFIAKWPIGVPNTCARSREEQTYFSIQERYQLESWISSRLRCSPGKAGHRRS